MTASPKEFAGRSEDRAERTRTALLDAAEAVFANDGFTGARLEDVARRVGIRRASIVYHFRDKRELYDALLERLFSQVLDAYRNASSVDGTHADYLEAMIRIWFGFCREHPAVPRILLREVADATEQAHPAMLRHLRPLIDAVADVVAAGQASGEFRAVEPMHFIFAMAGAMSFLLAGPRALVPDIDQALNLGRQLDIAEDVAVAMARCSLAPDRPQRAR